MTEESKKMGRPRSFVRYQGQEIFGLSLHKTKGTYYTIDKDGNRKSFGSDLQAAVFKYRVWQAEQKGERIILQMPYGDSRTGRKTEWEEFVASPQAVHWSTELGMEIEIGRGDVIEVPPEIIWEKAREIILADPIEASRKLNIPQIANLHNLKPLPPSLTLQEVADLYYNKRKKLTKHEKMDSESFWNQFCGIVGVKTIREITVDHIHKYQNEIYDIQQRNEYSPVWICHRFSKIITMLRNAMKNGRNQNELQEVLNYCKIFEFPSKPDLDPNPISKEHFQLMLSQCGIKFRAILLLALNCGLYPKDFFDLQREHVDLERKTLNMIRKKKATRRIGVLWDRTVDAIKAYQAEQKNDTDNVFITEIGTPINAHRIRTYWKHLREKLRQDKELMDKLYVPEDLYFEQIRDGSQTAAIEGGATEEQVSYLMGHKAKGVTDAYLKRNPKLVTQASRSIELYYFGTSSVGETSE